MAGEMNTLNNSSFNQLTAEQAEFYQRAMLERLLPELVLMNYGEKKNIPKNSGATTSFRRLNKLNVATTAVTEGVTPAAVTLDVSKITATVKSYGNWTKITDELDLMGLDPILTETSELMGENAGESIETIVRDIVTAGTNVIYAGGKTARNLITAADKITRASMLKVRRTLKQNKVKPIKLPDGSTGYLAFTHTNVITDLMQGPDWKTLNTQINNKNMIAGIVGKMDGIYYLEYDLATKFAGAGASSADVYATMVLGKGYFGVPDIEGSSKPEIIVHKAGSAGTSDPLNQFNTVGWKAVLTAVRLNELSGIRFESGATV